MNEISNHTIEKMGQAVQKVTRNILGPEEAPRINVRAFERAEVLRQLGDQLHDAADELDELAGKVNYG